MTINKTKQTQRQPWNVLWLLVMMGWCNHFLPTSFALENGLARTPPMGWLAWERFVCEINCQLYPDECIDDKLFAEMGHRMVEDGFLELGYQYVNIDDCWSLKRRHNESMRLIPDPARFRNGSLRPLADELHSIGLKLGLYGDCGTKTCQLFPGQLANDSSLEGNFYKLDAQQFADEWQVDSFKFDGCSMKVNLAAELCPPMGQALNNTDRPMLFSCSWPAYENDEQLPTNWDLVRDSCNLWRAFGDIEDSWKSVIETIDLFVKKQDLILRYHGPGHWFDADQLIIGDFGLSHDQEIAQMAIWCIWASPLYMSNDLRRISPQSAAILKNKWAIQVNQDPMGLFGMMVAQYGKYLQAFVKPLEEYQTSCHSYAVVYLDRRTIGNGRVNSFSLKELIGNVHLKLAKLLGGHWLDQPQVSCGDGCCDIFDVYDLFDDNKLITSNISLATGRLELRVNPSGARMVKLVRRN